MTDKRKLEWLGSVITLSQQRIGQVSVEVLNIVFGVKCAWSWGRKAQQVTGGEGQGSFPSFAGREAAV